MPRKYADINLLMSKEYWDYQSYEVSGWNDQNRYKVLNKIGKGKYSEVFEGIDSVVGKKVVIKMLKPIREAKINREIKVLHNLANGTNIISLVDITRDSDNKTSNLIFEYLHN